uniref:hypothetical protein n=1 Tax=Salmonella sp. s51228 TaxID=3159652 RepID=UPI003980C7B9
IGPTGPPNRGYNAITGESGWGISWYLNGKLIPEVYLKRGETYTFTENGGFSTNPPSSYHPFYLTNSTVGGILGRQYAGLDISDETIYAGLEVVSGVVMDFNQYPLCQYTVIPGSNEDVPTYDEFKDLSSPLSCNYACGFKFTPDATTPDTIYYQCATHQLLGWKIHIVDTYPNPQCASAGSQLAQISPIILMAMLLAVLLL